MKDNYKTRQSDKFKFVKRTEKTVSNEKINKKSKKIKKWKK